MTFERIRWRFCHTSVGNPEADGWLRRSVREKKEMTFRASRLPHYSDYAYRSKLEYPCMISRGHL